MLYDTDEDHLDEGDMDEDLDMDEDNEDKETHLCGWCCDSNRPVLLACGHGEGGVHLDLGGGEGCGGHLRDDSLDGIVYDAVLLGDQGFELGSVDSHHRVAAGWLTYRESMNRRTG